MSRSLKALFPEIAAEWHSTKNGSLTPDNIAPKSNKKVWWLCSKGHEHQTVVANRTRTKGGGCPFCSGHRATPETLLKTMYPDIAAQWHPTKNDNLILGDITFSSNRNVWWRCSKGPEHEWLTTVNNRTGANKSGCPFCAGQRVTSETSLKALHPAIAKQWHPTKNGTLQPDGVLPKSHKKVWWHCSKGHKHEWQAKLADRTRTKIASCPFCSGRRVSETNSLARLYPRIAAEWHPTKNGSLRPSDVTSRSNKNIWWWCPNWQGHEWQAMVHNRTGVNETGCHTCNQPGSKAQLFLYNIIKEIYPNYKVYQNYSGFDWLRTKKGKMHLDIWVPAIKFATEYDGEGHFRPIHYGSMTQEEAEENLKKCQARDKLKDKLIAGRPDVIKRFIRFSYKDTITKELVVERING